MEVILLPSLEAITVANRLRFNPCFYGSYSFTRRNSTH